MSLLWVGIGCGRGTSRWAIEGAIRQVCQTYQLAEEAIAGIATLDLKANEIGLLELCRDRQWPLRCFSAEQLRSVPVSTPAAYVGAAVGTPSVAEAAAILACQPSGKSQPSLIQVKLRVSKQIVRIDESSRGVTVAIAQPSKLDPQE